MKDDSEPWPHGGRGTCARSTPGPGWVRLGSPSLHPSSPLRSLLQKHPPSTCQPGLGPDSPPPQGLGAREAELEQTRDTAEQTGDTASPCLLKKPVPSSLASPAQLAATASRWLAENGVAQPLRGDGRCRALSAPPAPHHSSAQAGTASAPLPAAGTPVLAAPVHSTSRKKHIPVTLQPGGDQAPAWPSWKSQILLFT